MDPFQSEIEDTKLKISKDIEQLNNVYVDVLKVLEYLTTDDKPLIEVGDQMIQILYMIETNVFEVRKSMTESHAKITNIVKVGNQPSTANEGVKPE